MLGTVAGYRFYVASEYIISSENASDRITLNVIGVSGDHEEYYLRTVPVSDNASIKLKRYNIPDAEIIKMDVISNYQHEQDRKRELKKKDKKGSWIIDIILDIMYSALPVIFFVYLFAHNHVSKTTMFIIMAVVLVIVVLIAQLSGLFYDKVLKKPIDKVITNDSDKKDFDINSVFNENHIRYIVHDKERYQNKE